MVPGGSPVGLRTALVTPALCAALAGVPDTDQTFFPASPGLLARLDATAVVAPPTLRSFIRTLLSWLRAHPAATSVNLPPRGRPRAGSPPHPPPRMCASLKPQRSVPARHHLPPSFASANGGGKAACGRLRRTQALEHLFHHRSVGRRSVGAKDDLHPEVAACILEPDDIAGLVGARGVGLVHRA
jgi:hypothetical protein